MKKYLRFLFGTAKYLKSRIEPYEAIDSAKKILQDRIIHREENFLNLIEKGVFNYSESPYLKLLSIRKINFPDIKKWVGKDGIENTLSKLLSDGVYFTVDEFKGKSTVNRNGLKFQCTEFIYFISIDIMISGNNKKFVLINTQFRR